MTNRIKNVCKHAATAALVLISLFAISGCQTTKTKTTVVSDKEKTVESSKVIEKTTIPTLFSMATAGQKIPLKGCCNVWKKSKSSKRISFNSRSRWTNTSRRGLVWKSRQPDGPSIV